ncbi:MAG TPA: VIT domain-containing protein [Pyrinomonadaceae bacterium]|nr:VIT domain-containing protein [Pyrinomonadaceae bacterium]
MQQQVQGVPGGPVGRWRGTPHALAFTMFGGVVLPAVSILVETASHICAQTFFDPIPTPWHVVMVVFVPLAHLQVWLAVNKGSTERPVLLGLANAAAIGISAFYTIIYLPVLPIAFVTLILAGMGLLPMAPLLSLASGLILRRHLRRIAPPSQAVRWRGLAMGLAISVAAVVLVELPITLTRVGLQMASRSSPPERRARGLRLLRDWGNRDYLLRACYQRVGEATDLVGFLFSAGEPVAPQEAREIYYRLTGETFDTSRPPRRLKGQLRPEDTFDFDPDQGGTVIAGKVKGLSLSSSLMDGSVDADAALGYVEWTLTFKNVSDVQREARAQVRLPPGGVVSRLTLWVNGEPREAAFAARERTRAAYQEVVRVERRDPVLVTTSGRDRVLVQAFPVPPQGGELKLRFGVSAPLVLEDRSRALLRLPHFLDRNFGIPEEVKHSVWVESKRPLQAESKGMRAERPEESLYAVRGTYNDAELSGPANVLRAERAAEVTQSWTRDPLKQGEVVRQSIREGETPVPSRVVLVVDTSGSMRGHGAEIAAALKSLPPNVETRLILADGNGAYEEGFSQHAASASAPELARLLEAASFEGGADNVPALTKAWEVASERPGGVVVWVHGSQGIEIWPVGELRRVIERRPEGPVLYTLQAAGGRDRIEEGLDGVHSVKSVPRLGRLRSDLERLFAQLSGQRRALELVRTSEKLAPTADSLADGKETSAHLARLWANDEVARLIAGQEKDANEKAVKVAAQYQLVTPVSGAVVLETAQQYERAGLKPVEAGTVPTIPEPETVLLVAVVAAILLFTLYRRRRGGARGLAG